MPVNGEEAAATENGKPPGATHLRGLVTRPYILCFALVLAFYFSMF